MKRTRHSSEYPLGVALPVLLGLAGCFTDLTHPPPEDAYAEPGDVAIPGPDGPGQESQPVTIDGGKDVPLAGTGGAGGFDGGRDVEPPDGPIGSGGGGGIGGLIGAGGTSAGSGGAGGAVVGDAPADQKPTGIVGSPCTLNSDCALGNCVDGICCATACAGCNACASALTGQADGTCAAVLTGKDPHDICADQTATNECGNDDTCDGAGACRKVSTSHVCKPGSCSSTTFTPASTCDGLGACTTPTPEDCAPYQCAATGCLKLCTSQTECGATSYCKITSGTTGTCTAKNPNGTPATQGFECTSGIVADGVCCDKACAGCSACSGAPLTGAPAGTCSFVLDGQIAHSACTASGVTCGLDGKCDGAGACRATPKEGQSCNDPANKCITGRVCQNRVCTTGTTTTCPPSTLQYRGAGTCDPSTGSCAYPWALDGASCTDNNSCTNDVCQSGSCVSTQILCNDPPACKQSTTCSGGTCSYTVNVTNGTADAKCPGGTPYCYGGTCVRCTSDTQCSLPTPSCNPSSHTCVCKRPSAGNVLKNPGFDGSLADWNAGSQVSYSTIDADGCTGSGSFYVNGSTEGDPWQCITIQPGQTYSVGLRLRGGQAGGQIRLDFMGGVNCTGSIVDQQTPITLQPSGDLTTWFWITGYSFTAPTNAVSAKFRIYGWDQWFDQLFVNADGSIF